MMRLVIHVDCLALKGFCYEDRHDISAGLQQELTRLLADPHAAQQIIGRESVSQLRVGSINVNYGFTAQRIGMEAARGIGREMRK